MVSAVKPSDSCFCSRFIIFIPRLSRRSLFQEVGKAVGEEARYMQDVGVMWGDYLGAEPSEGVLLALLRLLLLAF